MIGQFGKFDFNKQQRDFREEFWGIEATCFQKEEDVEMLRREIEKLGVGLGIHFPLRQNLWRLRDPQYLSKSYSKDEIKILRNQWDQDIYFNEEFSMKDKDNSIYDIWNEILLEIKYLPKDKNSYGLVHYDFHQYNFFIDNGEITVFDFDDCLYHWFACDIAIAIYHGIEAMRFTNYKEKNQFASNFIKNFMKGYLSETYIDKYWVEKIPIFLEYRRICSYSFMYKILERKDLDEGRKEYITNMIKEIENRVPYIDFNFKCIV